MTVACYESAVSNDALIKAAVTLTDNPAIVGAPLIYSDLFMSGTSFIGGKVCIKGLTRMFDATRIMGNVVIKGALELHNSATIKDKSVVSGNTILKGNVIVKDDSLVANIQEDKNAVFLGRARVCGPSDYFYFEHEDFEYEATGHIDAGTDIGVRLTLIHKQRRVMFSDTWRKMITSNALRNTSNYPMWKMILSHWCLRLERRLSKVGAPMWEAAGKEVSHCEKPLMDLHYRINPL